MVPGRCPEPCAAGQGQAAVPWREVLANRWVVASLGWPRPPLLWALLSAPHTQKLGPPVRHLLPPFPWPIPWGHGQVPRIAWAQGGGALSLPCSAWPVAWCGSAVPLGLRALHGFGFKGQTGAFGFGHDKTKERERAQAVTFYNNCIDLGMSGGAMLLGGVAALSYNLLWILLSLIAAAGFALVLLGMPREGAAPAPAEGKWRK